MTDAARATQLWLLDRGRRFETVAELLEGLATELGRTVALDRVWLGTIVLHPQAAAWFWVWERDAAVRKVALGYERFGAMVSVDSPVRRLRRGAEFVRYTRAVRPEPDLAEVAALWERGFADFYGHSVTFRGEWVGAVTWATRADGGFGAEEVALFDAILPTLSAVFEPLAREMVMQTLLRTYLGEDAGNRVAAGQVRRGDGETVRAAVWFCDVRGFTRLAAELERPALLELLNGVFDAVCASLDAHGGQVLKFIGDGVLGVFPADGDEARACARASAAAEELQERLAVWRAARAEAGKPGAEVGVGLHLGEVMYGNVGAPSRLDFTVIGSAVNLAARVEGLCGRAGHRVLATRAVADRVPGWREVGAFELKGVEGLTAVYTRGA